MQYFLLQCIDMIVKLLSYVGHTFLYKFIYLLSTSVIIVCSSRTLYTSWINLKTKFKASIKCQLDNTSTEKKIKKIYWLACRVLDDCDNIREAQILPILYKEKNKWNKDSPRPDCKTIW